RVLTGSLSVEGPQDLLVRRSIACSVRCPGALGAHPRTSRFRQATTEGAVGQQSFDHRGQAVRVSGRGYFATVRGVHDLTQSGQVADEDRDTHAHRLVRLERGDVTSGSL